MQKRSLTQKRSLVSKKMFCVSRFLCLAVERSPFFWCREGLSFFVVVDVVVFFVVFPFVPVPFVLVPAFVPSLPLFHLYVLADLSVLLFFVDEVAVRPQEWQGRNPFVSLLSRTSIEFRHGWGEKRE
mmetsp:Transcript_6436/g.15895  ORF Transcript_6436/g.15895 Transcript_6436/m.15895 type:complete len:127 (+) Transcript_6436:446-826(+)